MGFVSIIAKVQFDWPDGSVQRYFGRITNKPFTSYAL